ncbi:MAG: hypothetical protein IJS26_02265 [Alphaproteobacteria bacterium]|nr:hypothetical protein [Alphaproteobacteria bacterium]
MERMRLTDEQIERLKAQGAAKRAERQAKKAKAEKAKAEADKKEEPNVALPKDLEERLYKMGLLLERSFGSVYKALTEEQVAELNELLTLGGKEERLEAYKHHQFGYENIIFYVWKLSGDAAFKFFDEVLSAPETDFSTNSLLRMVGCFADENLLTLVQRHQKKILNQQPFMLEIYRQAIAARLRKPFGRPLHEDEKEILQKLLKIFGN